MNMPERKKNEASLRSFFSISMNQSVQSLVSGIYAMLHIQFTKISKENHYYIRTNLEEIKKSQQ